RLDRGPLSADEDVARDVVAVAADAEEDPGPARADDPVVAEGVLARTDAAVPPLDIDPCGRAADDVASDHRIVRRMLEVDARPRPADDVVDNGGPGRRADSLDPVPAGAKDRVADDRRLDAAGPDAAFLRAAPWRGRARVAGVPRRVADVRDHVVEGEIVEGGGGTPVLLLAEQDSKGAEAADARADDARFARLVRPERKDARVSGSTAVDERVLNRDLGIRAPHVDAVLANASEPEALQSDVA